MRELWHEIAYVEFTATVTTTTATEAAPLTVVDSGTITYAAVPTLIEFFSPKLYLYGGGNGASLWDGVGAVNYGRIAIGETVGPTSMVTCFLARRLIPSAGSHSYKICIWTPNGPGPTSSAEAGVGGTTAFLPGYIRITQKGGA